MLDPDSLITWHPHPRFGVHVEL